MSAIATPRRKIAGVVNAERGTGVIAILQK